MSSVIAVQIRTRIQDAWSELDHRIKYKKSILLDLKRRVNRLAALFDLADSEFLHIRDESKQLAVEAETNARVSVAPLLADSNEVSSNGPAQALDSASSLKADAVEVRGQEPLDVFQFLAVIRPIFEGYPFDAAQADGFVQHVGQRPADQIAAHGRNDAEAAAMVAAFGNLEVSVVPRR